MASPLFAMMAELAADSQKLEQFNSDPESLMNEYGLSDEQKALLASANQEDFTQAIISEGHSQFATEQRMCL